MGIVDRVTPHIPEAHNLGYFYCLFAATAFAFAFHNTVTFPQFVGGLALLGLPQVGGSVASAIKAHAPGEKQTPEAPAPTPN